jgi:hypothetical protein
MIRKFKQTKRIEYRWRFSQECGEEYDFFEVGKNCEEINIHRPQGEGDIYVADIKINDKEQVAVRNPDKVFDEYEMIMESDDLPF